MLVISKLLELTTTKSNYLMTNYPTPSKSKKLVKRALKRPELFTEGDLAYFRIWKELQKQEKTSKPKSDYLK